MQEGASSDQNPEYARIVAREGFVVCVWCRVGCGKRGFVSFSVISSTQASYKLEARLRAKSSLDVGGRHFSPPLSRRRLDNARYERAQQPAPPLPRSLLATQHRENSLRYLRALQSRLFRSIF